MKYPNSKEMEQLNKNEIINLLVEAFKPSKNRVKEWISDLTFIEKVKPKPSFYFNWHFKRIADTIYDFIIPYAPKHGVILDLASYLYMWLLLRRRHRGRIICTSLDGETKELSTDSDHNLFHWRPIKLILGKDKIPFGNENVDVIVLTEVIEHLKVHPQFLLNDIHRVLKKSGRLIITTPNLLSWKKICGLLFKESHPYDSGCYGERSDSSMGHVYEYTPYQIICLLKHIGFKILHFETRNVYLNDNFCLLGKMLRIQYIFNLLTLFKFKLLYKHFQRFRSTIFIVAERSTSTPNSLLYDI